MREQHGLRMLQVRHAGQDHAPVRPGRRDQHAAQAQVRLHQLLAKRLGRQARIGRDLVVARATGMQALARLADPPRELGLDRHMDVLVLDIERELARIDQPLDLVQAPVDRAEVVTGDDALRGKHAGVGARPRDILPIQVLVNGQRCPERLRRGVHAALEPSAP